ncbi:MAG: hypothetical protein KC416_13410, partial [Myxococcales bacterium]|nr:hypothetical protein [Myxococcales bacterium]
GGATRTTIAPSTAGTTFAESQGLAGRDPIRLWCDGKGMLAVGATAWKGNGTIDVVCLPKSYGTYSEPNMSVLADHGCSDINTFGNTPVCARAAHLWCVGQGKQGIGPYWVWGAAGIACVNND